MNTCFQPVAYANLAENTVATCVKLWLSNLSAKRICATEAPFFEFRENVLFFVPFRKEFVGYLLRARDLRQHLAMLLLAAFSPADLLPLPPARAHHGISFPGCQT